MERRSKEGPSSAKPQAGIKLPRQVRLRGNEALPGRVTSNTGSGKQRPRQLRPEGGIESPGLAKERAGRADSSCAKPETGATKSTCAKLRKKGEAPAEAVSKYNIVKPTRKWLKIDIVLPGQASPRRDVALPKVRKSSTGGKESKQAKLRAGVESSTCVQSNTDREDSEPTCTAPQTDTGDPACKELCKGIGLPTPERVKASSASSSWVRLRINDGEPRLAHSAASVEEPGEALLGAGREASQRAKLRGASESPGRPKPTAEAADSGRAKLRDGNAAPKAATSATEGANTEPARTKPNVGGRRPMRAHPRAGENRPKCRKSSTEGTGPRWATERNGKKGPKCAASMAGSKNTEPKLAMPHKSAENPTHPGD